MLVNVLVAHLGARAREHGALHALLPDGRHKAENIVLDLLAYGGELGHFGHALGTSFTTQSRTFSLSG